MWTQPSPPVSPLPTPRGPLTGALRSILMGQASEAPPALRIDDALVGDDLHLALYLCYELAYRGVADVEPDMEWDAGVLAFRRRLESAFEQALRDECTDHGPVEDAEAAIGGLLRRSWGPSLSTYMEQEGTREQFRELLIHRSAYQLKEADPHTWAIPRLPAGRRKSALIEIQADEYGNGEVRQTHAELFGDTMRGADLNASYGHELDRLPGSTLATCNLVSMFGLRRELTAALLGHLAVFEMTSVEPMSRYSRAAQRFGFGAEVRRFYDVHVVADEHHAELARRALIGGDLAADGFDPAEVVFGAEALLRVEARFARHLLDAWRRGESSLRRHDAREDPGRQRP